MVLKKFDQYQLVNFIIGEIFVSLILNITGFWMIALFEGPMIRKFMNRLIVMSTSGRTDGTASLEKDLTNTE